MVRDFLIRFPCFSLNTLELLTEPLAIKAGVCQVPPALAPNFRSGLPIILRAMVTSQWTSSRHYASEQTYESAQTGNGSFFDLGLQSSYTVQSPQQSLMIPMIDNIEFGDSSIFPHHRYPENLSAGLMVFS